MAGADEPTEVADSYLMTAVHEPLARRSRGTVRPPQLIVDALVSAATDVVTLLPPDVSVNVHNPAFSTTAAYAPASTTPVLADQSTYVRTTSIGCRPGDGDGTPVGAEADGDTGAGGLVELVGALGTAAALLDGLVGSTTAGVAAWTVPTGPGVDDGAGASGPNLTM